MTETAPENNSKGWNRFLRKHWNMLAVFVIAAVVVAVGAVYVFLWFVAYAQATGLVPATLRFWTMGHILTFLLNLIFWEALLVGIPVAVAAVAGWLWWRTLPAEEKKEYRFFGTRSRATSGGAVSIFFWIAFAIKIYLDGNWNVAIATWTLDYFVYSLIWTLIWILVIFGIPIAIGLIWWINHKIKKNP